MVSKLKKKSFIFALALILLPISPPARAVDGPRTKCNIRVDDPHISKSIKRYRGFRAVKVNARSKCNVDMTNLRLTVEIYKKGFFKDHLVNREFVAVKGLVPRNVVIKNQDTWERCSNSRRTTYYGIAYASALIAGKKVNTPRVASLKLVSLNCGT